MIWSNYQLTVFDFLKNSNDNLFVNAVAGSGKTRTLEECNRKLPYMDDNFHCITRINTCFNVVIRETLQKKGLEAGTLNSLGWGVYRNNVPNVKFDQYKNNNWLRKKVDSKYFFRISNTVCRVVSLLKQLKLTTFPDNWIDICDNYGIEVGQIEDIDYWINATFNYSINELNIADFDDQIYQVVKEDFNVTKRDYCFIDEGQDLSQIKIDFSLKLGNRIIAVGDPDQAIYVFAGADINAIDNIIKATNAVSLPLSICYRCPKSVVRYAQRYVSRIEPYEEAIEGIVDYIDDLWDKVDNRDYVLCRTTAPLVKKCLKAIRLKKKAFVRGKDIGQSLKQIIDLGKELGASNNVPLFIGALKEYKEERIDALMKMNRSNEAISVEDRVETVIALAEDCDYVDQIDSLIKIIFSDEAKEGIEFSTIHKSKGQERKRVFCLRPDLLPHPKCKKHLIKIENNLAYVQCTRSMEELYFIGR